MSHSTEKSEMNQPPNRFLFCHVAMFFLGGRSRMSPLPGAIPDARSTPPGQAKEVVDSSRRTGPFCDAYRVDDPVEQSAEFTRVAMYSRPPAEHLFGRYCDACWSRGDLQAALPAGFVIRRLAGFPLKKRGGSPRGLAC